MVVFAARAAIRGGNFNNTGNAGVFNLNNAPSNANNNIGFRAGKHTGFFSQTKGHIPFCSARVTWNHGPHPSGEK